MIHPLHEKYAQLLIHYCCALQPGETVSINVDTPALDMARALYREALKADANPVLHLSYPEITEDLIELASDRFLKAEPLLELSEIQQIDAWIRLRAPSNTTALQEADKHRYAQLLKKQRPVQNHRVEHTRWVGCLYPTNALAQDAGMSLDAYSDFVYGAMFLFDEDPVARWQDIHNFQAKLIEHLKTAQEIHLQGPGTDLKLRTRGRSWVNSDGHRNMPSGEVFTAPIEDSANGIITFDVPSSVNGSEVQTIRLVFKHGKVVEASAEKGNDMLQAQLETDAGARLLGELGIGTNYNIQRPTKQILFDEKIGGTVHLALGQAYKECGGTNESAIHWDMICDLREDGAIYVDGELFQQNGKFLV